MNLAEIVVTKWILEVVLVPSAQIEGPGHESFGSYRYIESQLGSNEQKISPRGTLESRDNILRYLPILVIHSFTTTELGSPFNIFEPTRGVSIYQLPTPLTKYEKKVVDFQQGQLVRQLSGFTSPDGVFGSAIAVIGPSQAPADLHGTQQANLGFRGAKTWRHAFHSLLEGVLRDGEDMAVTMSYEPIRGYFNRLGHLLDGVTVARLVILDASNESNVLVSRSTKSTEKGDDRQAQSTSSQETERSSEGNEDRGPSDRPTINITGLRDWSNCLFGDPLMTETFSQDPTPEFLRGFRGPQQPSPHTSSETAPRVAAEHSNPYHNTVIEDPENAPVRILLYECYHATVEVVGQFYRPGPSSSDREITARRRLATVLRKLDAVDEDVALKRPRRPSAQVEAWPVKKAKSDSLLPSIESPERA